jgi:PAS domain S-box-containing protein
MQAGEPGERATRTLRTRLAGYSMRAKLTLVVLLTTAMALLVAGTAMLSHDLQVYRQSWASDLQTEAGILALSTAPALAFDDHRIAERNVSALRARPAVLAAALYGADGVLYASYVRAREPALPATLAIAPTAPRISGERVEVVELVVQNGETLGAVYLRARYDVSGRIKAYLGIFALVMLMSMAVALTLSTLLRRVITGPLDAMAEVARQVAVRRDFSLRVARASDDEIGVVVTAFNGMLEEMQLRTGALEESNRALRESEKLYRAIGESIDYGVWICDAGGRNVYASDSFLRLAGITQQQCSHLGWGDLLHPDDVSATLSAWLECVRSGAVWYREHRVRGVDGRYHAILAQGVPIKADDGAITGWAGINLDIGRLKQTEEALRDADRRKDEFLATLAHELRNPLAPIRHAVRLLEVTSIDERQRQWAREIISRQVQRMALLLDDLLDVSRITRGRLELRKDYVDLAALVAAAVETARPLIDSKRHELKIVLPPESVQLEGDPLRLSQALSNLLTNAAKYTDTGGVISLVVTVGDEIRIAVQDSGIGLSAAAIPHVFEMFSQVDSAIDRAEGGLGIGLALVKGLVGLHGGTIEVTSAGLGCGSEFTIRLPATLLVSAPRPPGHEVRMVAATAVAGCKVLVADDNRDAADTLALLLESRGYEVVVAYSGVQALEVGRRHRPRAAILDIGMPELNGYETARRIRQEAWGRHALLLAVTGWGQENDKEQTRAAGFDHHLTKPVDPRSVEQLLDDFVRSSGTGSGADVGLPMVSPAGTS